MDKELNSTPRPHRLVIPVVAALAVTCTVIFFHVLENYGVQPDHAASLAAGGSFLVTLLVGLACHPHLGDV